MEDKHPSEPLTPTGENPAAGSETEAVAGAHDATAGASGEGPDLGAALASAEAKIAELEDARMRAAAEAENARRRAQEDVARAHKFALESFAEHLLPVIDSLEAAASDSSNDIGKLKEGVELTLRQLLSALQKGRIVAISPVGEKFDPHRHQAISMVPAEQEPNTVVSVLQKGYLISDRVLRPALVTVSQPK